MTGSLSSESWNILTSQPKLKSLVMGDELADMAETRADIVMMTADLMFSNGSQGFQQRHPDRYINTGIAEQNMMSVAAGLAASGFVPYVSTFASFASLLCAEQMRTDIAYPNLKVRILAHHAGISMGFYGTSHHAVEDLALTRAMANMTVVTACDANATRGILRATLDAPGPVYIRTGRGADKQVYDHVPDFAPGRFQAIREGRHATIIATGVGVRPALDAAEALAAEGLSVRVLDAVYIKPLDREAILAAAVETGAVLTVEEHNPNGGLGGAVAEVLAEAGLGVRFRRHALPDDYALVAPPTHLYRHYGLSPEGIQQALLAVLAD